MTVFCLFLRQTTSEFFRHQTWPLHSFPPFISHFILIFIILLSFSPVAETRRRHKCNLLSQVWLHRNAVLLLSQVCPISSAVYHLTVTIETSKCLYEYHHYHLITGVQSWTSLEKFKWSASLSTVVPAQWYGCNGTQPMNRLGAWPGSDSCSSRIVFFWKPMGTKTIRPLDLGSVHPALSLLSVGEFSAAQLAASGILMQVVS